MPVNSRNGGSENVFRHGRPPRPFLFIPALLLTLRFILARCVCFAIGCKRGGRPVHSLGKAVNWYEDGDYSGGPNPDLSLQLARNGWMIIWYIYYDSKTTPQQGIYYGLL